MGLRHIVVRSSLVSSLVAGAPLAVLGRSPGSIADGLDLKHCRRVVTTSCNTAVSLPRRRGSAAAGLNPQPATAGDVPTMFAQHRSLATERTAFTAALRPVTAVQPGGRTRRAPDAAIKAAFLYNFARFTEWPALLPDAPIVACIVGDAGIVAALIEIVRAQAASDSRLVLGRSDDTATWRTCQLLFISDSQIGPSAGALTAITTFPVLTVSDTKGFAQAGGIIELYPNAGQLRFAINVDAAERSGLRLSSRLLNLAKVIGQGKSGPK